jgi:hypothetical protein
MAQRLTMSLGRPSADAPTIGLLLCESHRSPIMEYTLRRIEKPIGVSSYRGRPESFRSPSGRRSRL